MDAEDVVPVLRRFSRALTPRGALLDLQVIPPAPLLEVDGLVVASLEAGSELDSSAAAARAAVDREIVRGRLREDARDDHDVLRHFPTGISLVEHYRTSARSLPPVLVPTVSADPRPHVIRERCRLRRLRVEASR